MLHMRALTRPSFFVAHPVSCTPVVPRRMVRAPCALPTMHVLVTARSVASLAQSDLRRIEGKLMQKYRPLAESMNAFHVSDDSLSEAIMESVESVGSADEQKRLGAVPAAPPPTAATPLDGIAKREKAQEEMYIARAEAELLRKLRSKLAGMKKARESPSERLKDGTRPRKATKSGSSPLQARRRGLEEDYIRRMEAEVLRKLREKKRAALEAKSAAQESNSE